MFTAKNNTVALLKRHEQSDHHAEFNVIITDKNDNLNCKWVPRCN